MPEPGSVGWSPPKPEAPSGLYRMSLTKVTSMLILTQQRRAVHTGTVEQLEAAARSVLTHNLLLGWWGIPFGLVFTPIALWRNHKNLTTIRQLARSQGAASGSPA
jgi:hypothetical protein